MILFIRTFFRHIRKYFTHYELASLRKGSVVSNEWLHLSMDFRVNDNGIDFQNLTMCKAVEVMNKDEE